MSSHSNPYVEEEAESINEFPYRKYELEPYVMDKLETLLTIQPNILNKIWTLHKDKVVSKTALYGLIDTVISTTLPDHWNYDKIIDYYSEYARIKTPGYGEKYSVYEYWNNPNLHNRWKTNSRTSDRELLYENITEARPAYASVAVSLYSVLSSLYKGKKKQCVLDIAAYGERAIAAANLEIEYHGVDPNYDLVEGHSRLIMDILTIKPNTRIQFYYLGLENFKSIRKYTFITYSPPPFNTEPYAGNKEAQTYHKYHTFLEYFCCFLTEIIYKASQLIADYGIFSITALDRNPDKFPIKIQNKNYISDNTKLIYVEPLLLVTSCMGFYYHGGIGLSVGGKPAQVPWWTFIYKKQYNDTTFILSLQKYYPEIFDRIGSRLLVNYSSSTALLNQYKTIKTYDNFKISAFNINKNDYSYNQKIFLELCRIRIQEYVCAMIANISKILYQKIQTFLGRYLMLRSITSTFEKPWLSHLYVDPVFPTGCDSEVDIALINNLNEQGCDNANYIVTKQKYWFASYELTGIAQLYDCIAHYMLTIPLSQVAITVEHLYKNRIKITGNDEAVNILKNIPGIKQVNNLLINKTSDIKMDILTFLRYEVLSAKGHQFTRSKARTEIIESIFDHTIVDIYASEYNNQSEYYCSIYPDVELKSYGSAFNLRMIKGAYLANPVDNPIFLKYSIQHILSNLKNAKQNNQDLMISMAFTVWLDEHPDILTDFKLNNIKNYGIKKLNESEYIQIAYILDSNKFPSIAHKEQVIAEHSRNTVSVGIILTSLRTTPLKVENVSKLVKSPNHIICNRL
jgi:hypothetical protein